MTMTTDGGVQVTRQVREHFWGRYNVAMGLHGSLIWEYHYHPSKLWRFRERIQCILDTHDFEAGGPPNWYWGIKKKARGNDP